MDALIGALGIIIAAVIVHLLYYRPKLKLKEKELELQIQDKAEKREGNIQAERTKKITYNSFEERYLDFLYERHRCLNIQGLKTRMPDAIELCSVYVPLKAYKPSDKQHKWTGDLNTEQPSPIDPDEQRRELQLERTKTQEKTRVDIAGVLRDRKKTVILGGPGCGKTTFLGYLALAFASKKHNEWIGVQRWRIPIYVECRDLNPDNLPDSDDLDSWCRPKMLKNHKPGDFFRNNINDGNCLILLDGLDEVASVDKRRKMVDWVHELTSVYGGNQFIVTSRIMGYEEAPLEEGFVSYYVSDFEQDDISKFVKNWYRTVEITLNGESEYVLAKAERDATNLIETIKKNDRIKRLVSNPLLLSITALVHRYYGKLPDSRATLYQDCVELLLGGKDEALGIELKLAPDKRLEVLKHLAYHMHCNETRNIEQRDLENVVKEPLLNAAGMSISVEEFLDEVRNRSGLLVERGQGTYAFSHLTFQEYLTALYLRDCHTDAIDILIEWKESAWWKETILLYCGLVAATAFVKRLLQCREDVLLVNLRLAASCIGESPSVDATLRSDVCAKLYRYYWDMPFTYLKWEILTALSETNDDETIDRFITQLDNTDLLIRISTVNALAIHSNERAVDALLACLDDKDSSINYMFYRSTAATALGNIGSEKTINPLIAKLDDHNNYIRSDAARALGIIGSERAVDALLDRLNDVDRFVRSSAAFALGIIGNDRAVDALLARLDDDDSIVRESAADALGSIGSEKAVDTLIAQLDDDDSDVRRSAAQALASKDYGKAVVPLIARLNDEDTFVRQWSANSLGKIGSERAVDPLIARLDDGDNDFRSRAAYALGRIGSERAVNPLIARLDDDAFNVCDSAADALGRIGGERIVDIFLARLGHDSWEARHRAVSALDRIGSKRAVEPLIARLDEDSPVKEMVAFALQRIITPAAAEQLLSRIDEKDKESGEYLYFITLFEYLQKNKLYIDELPPEIIERNLFWKENLKK